MLIKGHNQTIYRTHQFPAVFFTADMFIRNYGAAKRSGMILAALPVYLDPHIT